jgi:hypothetical protein
LIPTRKNRLFPKGLCLLIEFHSSVVNFIENNVHTQKNVVTTVHKSKSDNYVQYLLIDEQVNKRSIRWVRISQRNVRSTGISISEHKETYVRQYALPASLGGGV